jgi:hypothetical protein
LKWNECRRNDLVSDLVFCKSVSQMAVRLQLVFACQVFFVFLQSVSLISAKHKSKHVTCGDYRVLDSLTTLELDSRGTWPCSIFFNVNDACTPRLMCSKFEVRKKEVGIMRSRSSLSFELWHRDRDLRPSLSCLKHYSYEEYLLWCETRLSKYTYFKQLIPTYFQVEV